MEAELGLPMRKDRRAHHRHVTDVLDTIGVAFDDEFVARQMRALDALPAEMRASMLGDLASGRRLEAPWLCGRVAGLAAQAGIAAPVNATIYAGLSPYVDGARAWIQRGSMRFEVPTAQLRAIGRAAPGSTHVSITTVPDDDTSVRELSLIGLRANEAVVRLERFLDRAAQNGQESVRIVHGVGSGALRRAVRDHLATSPYCVGFRPGESNEGGGGVTVATLHA